MVNQVRSVLCIGACHIDYKFIGKKALVLKTSNPIISTYNYGGVIRNVAENLSKLDVDVSLMSIVGNDFEGDKLLTDTSKQMKVDLVDRVDLLGTGKYYAVLSQDGNMDVAYADMDVYNLMNRDWILSKKDYFNSYDWIVADMNVQKTGIESLIDLNKNNLFKLALIGVSAPKMDCLPKSLKGVDLLICNQDEAMAYLNSNEEDLRKLCSLLLSSGVKSVIITSGEKNVFFGSQDSEIKSIKVQRIETKDMVDVTGAGDSFSAALLYGLINDKSMDKSIVYGLVNARGTIADQDSVRKDLTVNKFKTEVENYETIFGN